MKTRILVKIGLLALVWSVNVATGQASDGGHATVDVSSDAVLVSPLAVVEEEYADVIIAEAPRVHLVERLAVQRIVNHSFARRVVVADAHCRQQRPAIRVLGNVVRRFRGAPRVRLFGW